MVKEYLFKIGLLGDGGVGKSSLIRRFVDNKFEADYKMTLGTDFMLKAMHVDGVEVTFQIWDAAGQERFQFMQNIIFNGLHGAFYVYDLKFPGTLFNLKFWIKKNQEKNQNYADCIEVVIGNKLDLYSGGGDGVTQESLDYFYKQISGSHISKYLYTSALTGEGVNEAFAEMGRILITRSDGR